MKALPQTIDVTEFVHPNGTIRLPDGMYQAECECIIRVSGWAEDMGALRCTVIEVCDGHDEDTARGDTGFPMWKTAWPSGAVTSQ